MFNETKKQLESVKSLLLKLSSEENRKELKAEEKWLHSTAFIKKVRELWYVDNATKEGQEISWSLLEKAFIESLKNLREGYPLITDLTPSTITARIYDCFYQAIREKSKLRKELTALWQLAGKTAFPFAMSLQGRAIDEEIMDSKICNIREIDIPEIRSKLYRVQQEVQAENRRRRVVGCGHPMNFK